MLKPFAQSEFIGLNKDLSPEKLSTKFFTTLINKRVKDKRTTERVKGCSLVKDIGADVGNYGFFPTRGEDFVLIWETTSNKILVYTWENDTLNAYNKWNDDNAVELVDGKDLTMTEKPWFVELNNEFYFGNMAQGIYKFRPGHQNIMRGSAPLDIIVEPWEEDDPAKEKSYTKWRFAYDYEYKGGRSPLSRNARVRLYSNKLQVRITMDMPPDISKNRRIYAQYDTGTDAVPSYSDWYFIKEVDDNNKLSVILDSELVDRVEDDGYVYSENANKGISPGAKMGISHEGRICLSYLKESPSIMQFTKVGQPYYDSKYLFDLEEAITNHVSNEVYVVASTKNKIFQIQVEPNGQKVLFGEGAYRDSMRYVGGWLYWVNELGFRRWDGRSAKPESVPGLNTVDFSDLQKEKRYHIFTDQQGFEQGVYTDGISSDYIPGGLSLQPNLFLMSGISGDLEGQWSGNYNDFVKTYEQTFIHQPFQFKGEASDFVIVNKLALFMKAYDADGQDGFAGWIAPDDGDGNPDLLLSARLAEFEGKVNGGDFYKRIFDLSKAIEFELNTTYHIIIPYCISGTGGHWEISFRERAEVGDDENPLYPEGEWMRESDDGSPGSWSDYMPKDDHKTILKFAFSGSGSVSFLSPLFWMSADWPWEGTLDSDTYDFAQDITPEIDCTLRRIEIGVMNKNPIEGNNPVIEIRNNSGGHATGSVIATASNFTHPGQQLIRADFDGGEAISAGTKIWVRIKKTTSAGYKYFEVTKRGITGEKSDDGGSSWTASESILWCKIFVSPTDKAAWATGGEWEGPIVDIGAGNSFKWLYSSLSQPTEAGIKIELNGFSEELNDWVGYTTLYDTTGANEVDHLPYDIVTEMAADITKIRTKVTLELATAKYTPIVDSILAIYEKDGDAGNKLHSGNVKGDYYLSVEDYDGNGSDEMTYVLNELGGWYQLSEPFFGYLSIGENICMGIGKNSNETYRNIYKLDYANASEWYSGDSKAIAIDTEIKTGKILWSNFSKKYRKFYLDVSANSDSNLVIDIYVGGGEKNADNDAINVFSDYFTVKACTDPEHIYFSLPKRMKGRWLEFKITGEDADWNLHGYEILYEPQRHRNISLLTFSSLEYLWYIDNDDDEKIKTFDLKTGSYVGYVSNPNGNTYQGLDVKRNYLCAMDDDEYFYIYSIADNGTLTLLNTGGTKVAIGSSIVYPCIMDAGAFNAFVSFKAADNKAKIYKINLSDKTTPSVSVEIDISSIISGNAVAINWMEDYLIISSSSSDPFAKWNTKTKVLTSVGEETKDEMDVYDKYAAINSTVDPAKGIKVYDLKTKSLFSSVSTSPLIVTFLSFDTSGNLYALLWDFNTDHIYLKRYNLDLTEIKSIDLGYTSDIAGLNIIAKSEVYVFFPSAESTKQIIRYNKSLVLQEIYENSEFETLNREGFLALQNKHG